MTKWITSKGLRTDTVNLLTNHEPALCSSIENSFDISASLFTGKLQSVPVAFLDNATMDLAPNPNLEELYRRVIADPGSATRADRNAVFRLPPPDEEDRLCVAKTGSTVPELRKKALTEPEKLTYSSNTGGVSYSR
jgi:hypothetical protein